MTYHCQPKLVPVVIPQLSTGGERFKCGVLAATLTRETCGKRNATPTSPGGDNRCPLCVIGRTHAKGEAHPDCPTVAAPVPPAGHKPPVAKHAPLLAPETRQPESLPVLVTERPEPLVAPPQNLPRPKKPAYRATERKLVWIEHNGEVLSRKEWGKRLGVSENTIARRLAAGLPIDHPRHQKPGFSPEKRRRLANPGGRFAKLSKAKQAAAVIGQVPVEPVINTECPVPEYDLWCPPK